MVYGLILAGGKGSRLYPLSRANKPKQFLDIINNETLLYSTLSRISRIIDKKNLYIITNTDYKEKVCSESAKFLNESNVIVEPLNKETAICIAFACTKILKKDKDAVILIFPSDHYIEISDIFYNTLEYIMDISNKKRGILTIGIEPKIPKTGYGYIQVGRPLNLCTRSHNFDVYKVERFVEKPSYEIAKDFVMQGNYLWNSGIFCFRADVYLRELEKYLPKVYVGMVDIYKNLGSVDEDFIIDKVYEKLDGISIDFGIMQKTRKAYVVRSRFYWDDIGSFTSLIRVLEENGKNFTRGNVLLEDSENCLIFGNSNLTVTFGVKDLIIVNTGDVTLIMNKNKEQEVKYLFEMIKGETKFKDFI